MLQPFATAKELAGTDKHNDRQGADRYAYGLRQEVAFFDGEGPPPDELFVEAVCRDLSETGISFYVLVAPACPEMTIRFRLGEHRYLVRANVVHHKCVKFGAREGYLLGCRFGENPIEVTDSRLAAHSDSLAMLLRGPGSLPGFGLHPGLALVTSGFFYAYSVQPGRTAHKNSRPEANRGGFAQPHHTAARSAIIAKDHVRYAARTL